MFVPFFQHCIRLRLYFEYFSVSIISLVMSRGPRHLSGYLMAPPTPPPRPRYPVFFGNRPPLVPCGHLRPPPVWWPIPPGSTNQPPIFRDSRPPPLTRFICCPPPPVQVEETVESLFNSWLAQNESRLRECVLQRKAQNPKLPLFFASLTRWNLLIQHLRELRSNDSQVDPVLKNELMRLEQECSNPDLLDSIQMKLCKIRKKRRYKRRQKLRAQVSNDSVVLQSSVGEVLGRLRALETDTPVETSTISYENVSQKDVASEASVAKELDSKSQNLVIELGRVTAQCKDRLALLDELEQLRTARITQARKQGGLFPEALDLAFTAQINELRRMLKNQLENLEAAEPIRKQSEETVSTSAPGEAHMICCDHFPGLEHWKKEILFGNESDQPELPWRWKRFYHQADFDFVDFLRIRTAWDAYLISSTEAPGEDHSDQMQTEQVDLSQLPNSWILPPQVPSNGAWSEYLDPNE
ncbi:hypothetical protein EG68_06931 [Paragonimus skrjabini miyazakii]|uniref:Uncharacterized protein n=1 Tax=Paragonimus skrjabini miyazakii TaxID=59628 RepID=A0A8S9YRZ9_9TREM|nr:hypothetical protein EG68_06931 [Paragonimus skrjabini miyazakii]